MHTKKRGWFCSRCPRHEGPCALRPRPWNIISWIQYNLKKGT